MMPSRRLVPNNTLHATGLHPARERDRLADNHTSYRGK